VSRVRKKYLSVGSDESNNYKILKHASPNQINVIELFAGAGGLALGMKNAGLKSELLVEIDKHACQTLKDNVPDWNVVCEDIHKIDFTDYHGKIDVITGGFPCQVFSYAGNSMGFEDARGTLFFEFARCIKEVQQRLP
jgi:DNA (cytosine-5)-methyltransferase 1